MLSEHPEILNSYTIQLYNLINKGTCTQIRKQEHIKYAAKIKKVGGRIKLFTAFVKNIYVIFNSLRSKKQKGKKYRRKITLLRRVYLTVKYSDEYV